jgi:hypothetical protein
MSQKPGSAVAVVGIDIGKKSSVKNVSEPGLCEAGDQAAAVNRRSSMTPPISSGSETYRADRRRDPAPINIAAMLGTKMDADLLDSIFGSKSGLFDLFCLAALGHLRLSICEPCVP